MVDVVYVPLSQRISNKFVIHFIASCSSVDIIARTGCSLTLFLFIFQSILLMQCFDLLTVLIINRGAVWEMRKWSYAIGGNIVTKETQDEETMARSHD